MPRLRSLFISCKTLKMLPEGLQDMAALKRLVLWVYYVGPKRWEKLSGDDVEDLHDKHCLVVPSPVEQEILNPSGWMTITSCGCFALLCFPALD
ncbi:unnamed protein product [Spirodela intermedia]|uniref:Uncharacterized protein n=1 Tax=Spirodela intermedia TaxID=51605 RepID=A0A7I8J3T9_SPIIN|nr:unnamed protein product [Spirodela intermedia]CAA6664020.1 unnamed protein product [Spirodela intermedia]